MKTIISAIITLLFAIVSVVFPNLNLTISGKDVTTAVSETSTAVTESTTESTTASTTESTTQKSETMIWPVLLPSHVIAGYPNYNSGGYHGGIDIALTEGTTKGTPFYAVKSGTVITAFNDGQYNTGFGNYCIIDHHDGTRTLYAHAERITVTEGETVSQGQLLGFIGDTGNTTCPHLHFEVRKADENGNYSRVNPLDYVTCPDA